MTIENVAIELRPVNQLLVDDDGTPARYWIPAYQRGYRWTKLQVTQLLDDIWNFIQTSSGKEKTQFYCLQPLVVRKLDGGQYEVVDGQQRLTTLFILLAHRKELVSILGKQKFEIDFETRDSDFLQNIDLKRSDENADFHHICEAWRAIDAWIDQRDPSHVLKLIQHLLNDDEVGTNVKVIWYQLEAGSDPIAAFTRLNVGKIPLTESELIRALFLKRARQDDGTGNLSLRIAYEWDQIEKRLQDDAFWYFLQNIEADANRISLIFRLETVIAGHSVVDEEYSVFAHFAETLSSPQSAEAQWQRVKAIFMALEEWYEDRELFHILGFILHHSRGSIKSIAKILQESLATGKQEFSKKLRAQVSDLVFDKQFASETSAKDFQEELANFCQTVQYRQADKVKKILLLFNLASLLEDPRSNIRFQFDSFKREGWDIEHIRSVSEKRPSRPDDQKEWLEHCKTFLASSAEAADKTLHRNIEDYLNPDLDAEKRDNFDDLDNKILRRFREFEGETDNGLSNLTLLDAGTNRGYGNAVFAVKRNILLRHDKSGIFVPLCTRNVFLKCYSRSVGNVMFWTKDDAQDYLDAICLTLAEFFCEPEANK